MKTFVHALLFPSMELLAQYSHFAWGAFLYLAVALLSGNPLFALLLVTAAAAVKEFVIDILTGQDPVGSVIDFFVYEAGMFAGLLVWIRS
jgi:hypothetical protein